jgi:hypothetical protein
MNTDNVVPPVRMIYGPHKWEARWSLGRDFSTPILEVPPKLKFKDFILGARQEMLLGPQCWMRTFSFDVKFNK